MLRYSDHDKRIHHTATYCNTLKHTATYCNTLQHTTPLCNNLQRIHKYQKAIRLFHHTLPSKKCSTLQTQTRNPTRPIAHSNRLQQTATHGNTMTDFDRLQHNYTPATTLNTTQQHNARHCNRLQHTATDCNARQHTATCCNTLQ